jgi:hypothetical protein
VGERDGGEIVVEDSTLAAGFVQVPHGVFFDPELRDGPVRVYGALLWWWWRDRHAPGQADMARQLGMSLRTVQRHLAELEEHGYMRVQQIGLGRANRYIITAVTCPDTPDLAGLDMTDLACLEPPTVAGPVRQSRRVQAAKSDAHTYILDSTSLDSTTQTLSLPLITQFLAATCQPQATSRVRDEVSNVVNDLLADGCTPEHVALAIEYAAAHGAYSPQYLYRAVGLAIGQQVAATARQEVVAQAAEEADRAAQAEVDAAIARVEALPAGERTELERLARERMEGHVPAGLHDRMLMGTMVQLLRVRSEEGA